MFLKIVTSDEIPFFVTKSDISKIGLFYALYDDLDNIPSGLEVKLMVSSQYFQLILDINNGKCDLTELSNADIKNLYDAADYLLLGVLCVKLSLVYSERIRAAKVHEITELLENF